MIRSESRRRSPARIARDGPSSEGRAPRGEDGRGDTPAEAPPRRVGAWGVSSRALPRSGSGELVCIRCASALELHQPDPDRPATLLGTCCRCGAWHIIAATDAGLDALAVEPPGEAGAGPRD